MLKSSNVYSALVAAVSISISQAESKAGEKPRIKCYGIAKEGEGDCAGYYPTGEPHSCPGAATKDRDPFAWLYTTPEECEKQGGSRLPPPPPPKSKVAE